MSYNDELEQIKKIEEKALGVKEDLEPYFLEHEKWRLWAIENGLEVEKITITKKGKKSII